VLSAFGHTDETAVTVELTSFGNLAVLSPKLFIYPMSITALHGSKNVFSASLNFNRPGELTWLMTGYDNRNNDLLVNMSVSLDFFSYFDRRSADVDIYFVTPRTRVINTGNVILQQALRPGMLTPGLSYSLLLIAAYYELDGESKPTDILEKYGSFSQITFAVPNVAKGGSFQITPSNGKALQTQFLLESRSWKVDDAAALPLSFQMAALYTSTLAEVQDAIDEGAVSMMQILAALGSADNLGTANSLRPYYGNSFVYSLLSAGLASNGKNLYIATCYFQYAATINFLIFSNFHPTYFLIQIIRLWELLQ
jgi:hypothetical protein